MKTRKIYWVTTPCNKENWFVVATDIQSAKDFHDHGEGFDEGYSKARFICDVPSPVLKKHFKEDEDWWPSLDLLRVLNFKVIQENFPRIVSYSGKIFYEGKGYLQILEDLVCDFQGVYIVNAMGSNMYKIGYTKNLKSRLKNIRTSLPSQLEIHYFIITNNYKNIEKHFHEEFKESRRIGEWFELFENDIEKLVLIADDLSRKNKFGFINLQKIKQSVGL